MNRHTRDLVRHLFTLATEILEDTHLVATKGQGAKLAPKDYLALSQRLRRSADDLGATAGAIAAALRSGHPRP